MLKTVGFPSTRTGDQTIIDGSLVIATAAEGVDFSANTPAAGMTSQLLDWYEEGVWTPTWNGGSVTVNDSDYTRVGRMVTWIADITFGASASVAESQLSFPFTLGISYGTGAINYTDAGASLSVNVSPSGVAFRSAMNAGGLACSALAGKRVIFMATYFV